MRKCQINNKSSSEDMFYVGRAKKKEIVSAATYYGQEAYYKV